MAPPHLSKKTSSTTSQTTSRHGARQVKQHIELYEEEINNDHNTADELPMLDAEREDLAGDTLTETQDASNPNPVQQLLRDMQADQHKRNEHRKKNVYKAYKDAHASTQEAITSYFYEHEARAVEVHEAQMAHLKDLLNIKAEIESDMVEKLDKLRKDYVYHSEAVEKVVAHRMNQLKRG